MVGDHVTEMCHMQFIVHYYVKIHEFFPGVVVPISVIMKKCWQWTGLVGDTFVNFYYIITHSFFLNFDGYLVVED